MSYTFRSTPPLTVGEIRKMLEYFPDDAVLKTTRYSEGFDISQGIYVKHLTDISGDGYLRFGPTVLDTFIPDEDFFSDDADSL